MTTDRSGRSGRARIVPVLLVPSAATAEPLAEALAGGGLRCVEVTMRTPDAGQVVATMAADRRLTVGAGSVQSPEQARRAVDAGARFIASPGIDEDLVAACRELGVPFVPGAATASQVMRARQAGLGLVKLFPAERLGGLAAIEALAAPFPDMRFLPAGGIGAGQAAGYLAHPSVSAVGGSWIAPRDCLQKGDFPRIRRLAEQAAKLGAS